MSKEALYRNWILPLVLCMGCHPHTRVNPAQHMIRKETQEPMWLQTIYKILFQHYKEASNTKRENGRMRMRACQGSNTHDWPSTLQ